MRITVSLRIPGTEFVLSSIAFTPVIVSYTLEILPYHLRAKGFNIFNFTISLALIFNQYVNPVALAKLGWKYYVSPFSTLISHRSFYSCSAARLRVLDLLRDRVLLHLCHRDKESDSGRDGRAFRRRGSDRVRHRSPRCRCHQREGVREGL